jgi:hypothetical protein
MALAILVTMSHNLLAKIEYLSLVMRHLEAARDETNCYPEARPGSAPLIENRRTFWPPASAVYDHYVEYGMSEARASRPYAVRPSRR